MMNLKYYQTTKWTLLFLAVIVNIGPVYTQGLSLKTSGNANVGYYVDVFKSDQLLVTREGEFSLQLNNLDLSAETRLLNWKGEQWSGNKDSVTLTGKTYIPELDAIITPLMGSVEAKDNEATIQWLMWGLLNRRRFGTELPQEKISRAVDYVLNEFDADRDGVCEAHFMLGQIDIIDYTPKTSQLALNQGMLAIALRTIRELGFEVSEEYISRAEQEYRNFYDDERKHLLFDRNYPDIISVTDLEPEFFSLWMFGRPILTDEMVKNHLNRIPALNKSSEAPYPEMGTTAPILLRLTDEKPGFTFLSGDYQPFGGFGEENYSGEKNDGWYYNGGSWFRAEYCAYVTGLKHGWDEAKKRMENRVWAEMYLNPHWPFSKEFIPTKWDSFQEWWPSTRGLCWNVFMLQANELAGLRTPDMDPDYDSVSEESQ